MGLAYDLKTTFRSPPEGASPEAINTYDWKEMMFPIIPTGAPNLAERYTGIRAENAGTDYFDIIIRNTTYINDFYIICGSYRAWFDELNGGAGAAAWDGFVVILRAFNIANQKGRSPNFEQAPGFDVTNQVYCYLCRMPLEVVPGLVGLDSDSVPGIYAVDVFKTGDALTKELNFYAAGHQRIDPASEGGLSDQSYTGWLSLLDFNYDSDDVDWADGSSFWALTFNSSNSIQQSWKASQANHAGRYLTNATAYPATLFDFDANAYDYNAITLLSTTGYYITRIYDIIGLSSLPPDTSEPGCLIIGESAKDNGAGATDYTTVMFAHQQFFGTGLNRCTTSVDTNICLDGDIAAYNLENAYFTVALPSVRGVAASDNTVLIGADRVTHGVTTYAEIYSVNLSDMIGGVISGAKVCTVFPFGIATGTFETTTGITLPDKWTGKCIQYSTFPNTLETAAKKLDTVTGQVVSPEGPGAAIGSGEGIADWELYNQLITDPMLEGQEPLPVNVYAGTQGNSMDYGLLSGGKPYVFGEPANIAYGFMGYSAATGPSVIMYDFGTLKNQIQAPQTDPPSFDMAISIREEGTNIANAIVESPTSTNRYPVSGVWDNDRDQWLFTFADPTGGSVVSTNSAFSNASASQVSFLDQTDSYSFDAPDQFYTYTAPQVAWHIPRLMTSALDGLTIWGADLVAGELGQRAMNPVSTTLVSDPTTSYSNPLFYTVNGTTGRTARVWIDYILYDGIDSLVATVIQELGLRVTVENVEWYKRKLLAGDKLNITSEEIEDWVTAQQKEYQDMLIKKERQGRLRRRRRQQSAIAHDLEEQIQGEFVDHTVFDFIEDDFIENNLKDLTSFPDQDEALSHQQTIDSRWIEGERLYGQSVPTKETILDKLQKKEKEPASVSDTSDNSDTSSDKSSDLDPSEPSADAKEE